MTNKKEIINKYIELVKVVKNSDVCANAQDALKFLCPSFVCNEVSSNKDKRNMDSSIYQEYLSIWTEIVLEVLGPNRPMEQYTSSIDLYKSMFNQMKPHKLQESVKVDGEGMAVVNKEYKYKRIETSKHAGLKCLLINEVAKVACIGRISNNEKFYTHYAPLPTF